MKPKDCILIFIFLLLNILSRKYFSNKNLEVSYCTAEEINEFIKDKFSIDIPIIVISKSVLKISKISNEKNDLQVYENGNSFQIHYAYFDDIRIEEKEVLFNSKLEQIERNYQNFLQVQGYSVTENTEVLMDYVN